MKKKTAVLFTTIILSVLLLVQASAQHRPPPVLDFTPHTASLLLVDLNTGETVYSQNANEVRPMASLTKIMTYIVTAESVSDLESTMIEILDEPLEEVRNRGASMAGLEEYVGKSLSVLDVLYALMVPSGCDAGAELAYYVGRGDMQSFVDRMNDKAVELGCENTHYADAHGLSKENLTTAEDLYKIVSYAMGLSHFWEVVNTTHYSLPDSPIPMFSSVRIMDPVNGGRYYYRYAHGIKTGYTSKAGRCLVSTAEKGDAAYLCVALGGEYSEETNWGNAAMLDSAALYRWAFANFTDTIEVDIPQRFASIQLGDTLKLTANVVSNNTGENVQINWTSSAPEIAEVDSNGVVTAHALGQAIITAETQTGDFDTCAVSAGFYNGIHVTSDSGDYTSGAQAPVDWSAIKDSGLDYAVIRAGWGQEDAAGQRDEDFAFNATEAFRNGVPFGISFTAYAGSTEQAQAEAEFLLDELEEFTSIYECSPLVVYDMSDARFQEFTAEQNTGLALTFQRVIASHGYKTVCYGNRGLFSNIDLNDLAKAGMGLWYRSWPYVMEFTRFATVGSEAVIPQAWQYRSDMYLPEASQSYRTYASLIYMAGALADNYEAPALTSSLSEDGQSALLQWSVSGHPFSGFAIYRQEPNSDTAELIERLDSSTRRYQTDGSDQEYIYTVVGLVDDYLGNTAEVAGESVSVYFSPLEPKEIEVPADESENSLKTAGVALLFLAVGFLAGRVFPRKRKDKVHPH